MGVAVSGMHYTGMAAMSVRLDTVHGTLDGANALQFLLPLIIGISMVAGGLLGVIALSPNEDELRAEAEMMERIANLATTAPARHLQRPRRQEPREDEPENARAVSYFDRR
jgi:hypothetical protein